MIKLNVGNTWDIELLYKIKELNKEFRSKEIVVSELYGSIRSIYSGLTSARPDFRIKDLGSQSFREFADIAMNERIQINYTLNQSCVGKIDRNLYTKINLFLNNFSSYIDRLTVSHPLILEILKLLKSEIPIELSTILHINSIAQLIYLKKLYPKIDKLCVNLHRNRDISFLRRLNEKAKEIGVELELMVNEFCSYEGTSCFLRNSCYNLHAHGGNKERLYSNYPMGLCIQSRKNPVAWLKTRFILPQDLKRYKEKLGINHFKITGRTHPTKYINWLIETYMKQDYSENLLKLWGTKLDNVGKEKSEYSDDFPFDIPCDYLTNFLDYWFKKPDFRCEEHCEYDCSYCEEIWRYITEKEIGGGTI